jgi:ParB family chromosome partitioning protein
MSSKKRGLGRGLDALLSSSNHPAVAVSSEQAASEQSGELRRIAVEKMLRGTYQPRKDMDPQNLEELASSIRAQGVIQPIVVREINNERYEIIAGERRWRAAQIAGLDQVPCVVKSVNDETALAMALIENIQREDLNALEEAVALHRLLQEFELTHQQVADAVGRSRTAVTNLMRLIQLNEDVKVLLERGDIDMGHARALLALEGEQQSDVAKVVVAKGLTVRETEKLIHKLLNPIPPKAAPALDPNIKSLQEKLGEQLGTNVAIKHGNKGKGKVVIEYGSVDELEGILQHIQ